MNHPLVLKAEHISKTFTAHGNVEVLKDISLEVRQGQSISIEGKSGSGKSTLLHILGTLERPSKGHLSICDQKVCLKNIHTIRNQKVGFIFQSYHLLEDFSLIDNVLMPAKIARVDTRHHSPIISRAHSLISELGLSDKLNTPTKLLSGGEKQRACLARALINSPDIIFADEPTGNLDSANADRVCSLLFNLIQKEQKTLILVTHDKDLASLCNKSFLLKEGFLHPIDTLLSTGHLE